jgi:hypothetical protein
MKSGPVLVATLFALTSFPVLAQQAPSDSSPGAPPAQQNSTPSAQPQQSAPPDTAAPSATPQTTPDNQATPDSQSASPAATSQSSATAAAPAADMRPVHAELVGNLDTKTAKTGDDVVAETKGAVKTADGTEIPKGTKLLGKVVAVQPSGAGQNSQVALAFNQAELKGGQTLPIQSQIQAIEPAEGGAAASAPDSMSRNAGGSAGAGASSNGAPGSATGGSSSPAYEPPPTPQAQNGPPAGTVVAQTGKIEIRATSIPGILLANNQAGEQDPRMAQASSILLGSRQDVKLQGGTKLVIGVAAAPGASPAAAQ